jgi:hypothetical protein
MGQDGMSYVATKTTPKPTTSGGAEGVCAR